MSELLWFPNNLDSVVSYSQSESTFPELAPLEPLPTQTASQRRSSLRPGSSFVVGGNVNTLTRTPPQMNKNMMNQAGMNTITPSQSHVTPLGLRSANRDNLPTPSEQQTPKQQSTINKPQQLIKQNTNTATTTMTTTANSTPKVVEQEPISSALKQARARLSVSPRNEINGHVNKENFSPIAINNTTQSSPSTNTNSSNSLLSPLRFPGDEVSKVSVDVKSSSPSPAATTAVSANPFTISSSPLAVSLATESEIMNAVPIAWTTPIRVGGGRKSFQHAAPTSADPRVESAKERVASLLKSRRKSLAMVTPRQMNFALPPIAVTELTPYSASVEADLLANEDTNWVDALELDLSLQTPIQSPAPATAPISTTTMVEETNNILIVDEDLSADIPSPTTATILPASSCLEMETVVEEEGDDADTVGPLPSSLVPSTIVGPMTPVSEKSRIQTASPDTVSKVDRARFSRELIATITTLETPAPSAPKISEKVEAPILTAKPTTANAVKVETLEEKLEKVNKKTSRSTLLFFVCTLLVVFGGVAASLWLSSSSSPSSSSFAPNNVWTPAPASTKFVETIVPKVEIIEKIEIPTPTFEVVETTPDVVPVVEEVSTPIVNSLLIETAAPVESIVVELVDVAATAAPVELVEPVVVQDAIPAVAVDAPVVANVDPSEIVTTWSWSPEEVIVEEDLFALPHSAPSSSKIMSHTPMTIIIHPPIENEIIHQNFNKVIDQEMIVEKAPAFIEELKPIETIKLSTQPIVAEVIPVESVATFVESIVVESTLVAAEPIVVAPIVESIVVAEPIVEELVEPTTMPLIDVEPVMIESIETSNEDIIGSTHDIIEVPSMIETSIETVIAPIEMIVEETVIETVVETIETAPVVEQPTIIETPSSTTTVPSSSTISSMSSSLMIGGLVVLGAIGVWLQSLEFGMSTSSANLSSSSSSSSSSSTFVPHGVPTPAKSLSPGSSTPFSFAPTPSSMNETPFPLSSSRPSLSPIRPLRKIHFTPSTGERANGGGTSPAAFSDMASRLDAAEPALQAVASALAHGAAKVTKYVPANPTMITTPALRMTRATRDVVVADRLHVDVPMIIPPRMAAAPTPAPVEAPTTTTRTRATRRTTVQPSVETPHTATIETRRSSRLSRRV